MRYLNVLVGAALALTVAACSNPQFIIHPASNPTATKARQTIDSLIETSSLHPLAMGSFLFPNKGDLFRPLVPTDSRNAIVYVYRPQSDWSDQEVQAPGFFLNGEYLSGLKSGSYFWFEVPASQYYFNAKRPLAIVYLNTIFESDVFFEGNQRYFFRYDEENPGPEKATRDSAMLVVGPLRQMPEAQALLEISQTRVMGVGRVYLADQQPAWAPFEFYADAGPVPAERMDATASRIQNLRTEEEIRGSTGDEAATPSESSEPSERSGPAAPASSRRWWKPNTWF